MKLTRVKSLSDLRDALPDEFSKRARPCVVVENPVILGDAGTWHPPALVRVP